MRRLLLAPFLSLGVIASVLSAPAVAAAPPVPGSAEYQKRDETNQADAWGRTVGQLTDPLYLMAALARLGPVTFTTWMEQASRPNRPAITLQTLLPPAAMGDPLRADWAGRRGQSAEVAFKNRYGALLRGTVYAPLPGARDPYTGERLEGPFPSVVITPGSIQGMRPMYTWLAQDLAERGYVVLTFDVQGQGQSETFPHIGDLLLPSCGTGPKPPNEAGDCPGVPSQQAANFVYGTSDAIDFFYATPSSPVREAFNPLWKLVDRSPDPHPATPGRTTRLALAGHSLGAMAISHLQGVDDRVQTIIALDKLSSGSEAWPVRPVVPALGLQADYSFFPEAHEQAPDPARELNRGYRAWRTADVDAAVFVQRAATHLDYTDFPILLPASRNGGKVASAYAQAWLAKYLKHDPSADALLTGSSFRYFESGRWRELTVQRNLSFYFCSAYHFALASGSGTAHSDDVTNVGCG
ncbi:hypothetical protein [Actinocorallia longicatena]